MNNSISQNLDIANSIDPVVINIPLQEENLTTWGIFISSILLSGGAFISQILAQLQKSRCNTINCFCLKCSRKIDERISEP